MGRGLFLANSRQAAWQAEGYTDTDCNLVHPEAAVLRQLPTTPWERLVSGEPTATHRLRYDEEHAQRLVPPSVAFLKRAPQCTSFGMMEWGDVSRAYTMPAYDATGIVDKETHDQVLALAKLSSRPTAAQARAAGAILSLLKCMVPDGQGCQRLSLRQARLLTQIAVVTVLRRGQDPWRGAVRCSCPLFARAAQCAHELAVRALEGDASLVMSPLCSVPVTRGRQPQAANAYVSMESLDQKRQATADQKKRREHDAAAALSPKPKKPTLPVTSQEEQDGARAMSARELLPQVRSPDLLCVLRALYAMDGIRYAEAQCTGLGAAVQALMKREGTTAAVKARCEQIMQRWASERKP